MMGATREGGMGKRAAGLALISCLALLVSVPAQATHESVEGIIKVWSDTGISCPGNGACRVWEAAGCKQPAVYQNIYASDRDPVLSIRDIGAFTASSRRRADFIYLSRDERIPTSGTLWIEYVLFNGNCEQAGGSFFLFNSNAFGDSARLEISRGTKWIATWIRGFNSARPVDTRWKLQFCHSC